MKRQAYGFRGHEFFKPKILAIRKSKYELSNGLLLMGKRGGVLLPDEPLF
jgi:hypothetical protein